MSGPVAPGRASLLSSISESRTGRVGANALAAPITPGRRVPVVDRSKVDPGTLKAAEGMEAMFLDYMMKVMRETVPQSDLSMDSPATKIYQGMMDSEAAERAARAGGIGLADQIVAYLESQRYNLREPALSQGSQIAAAAPETRDTGRDTGRDTERDTGGIHESHPDRK